MHHARIDSYILKAMDESILIIASSLILSGHIGRALTASSIKDWQVASNAEEGLSFAAKIRPHYVVLDIAMVKGDLADYCTKIAAENNVSIILILNQPSTSQFSGIMADACNKCPQIIAACEFPLDVNYLVGTIVEHSSPKSSELSSIPNTSNEPVVNSLAHRLALDAWVKSQSEVLSCLYLSNDGKVKNTSGQVMESQGLAAHYLMVTARKIGSELGLTNLSEIHQHGPDQKFLMIDSGEQMIALNATSKIDLKWMAAKLTTNPS